MGTRRVSFTLIELLVAIAVIAVLMAVLLPSLGRARESAKRIVCSGQVKQVGIAVLAYASDYVNRMPTYNSNTAQSRPYLLNHSYALYRAGAIPELTANYRVFKLIGGQRLASDGPP